MKKLLAKTALIIIISTNLLIIWGGITYASFVPNDAKTILSDADDKPCISKVGPDTKKIVTFIEEPIFKAGGDDDYQIRDCYRHSLSWTKSEGTAPNKVWGTQQTFTSLSKLECLPLTYEEADKKAYRAVYSCYPIQAIVSKGGTTMIYHYIGTIYKWAAGFVGIISVTVIIISGAQISLGGGDTQTIDEAKKRIIQSLSGIALLFLSGLILNTINPTFFT